MIVSAPIALLSLIVLERNKDLLEEEAIKEVFNLSTNDSKVNYERIDKYFNDFLIYVKDNKLMQKAVASYLFIYFENLNHNNLCDSFLKVVKSINGDVSSCKISMSAFALGVVSTALMNDVIINKNTTKINFPPTVKSAMKYIESEGFKVEAWKHEE